MQFFGIPFVIHRCLSLDRLVDLRAAFQRFMLPSQRQILRYAPTCSLDPRALGLIPGGEFNEMLLRQLGQAVRLIRRSLSLEGGERAFQLRPRLRCRCASSCRSSASMAKPTMPIAIMPDITIEVLMLACPLTRTYPIPLEATINSAPTSDCQPRPALTRNPATIDRTDAGRSTS